MSAPVVLGLGLFVFLVGVGLGWTGYGGFLVPLALVGVLGLEPSSAVLHGFLITVLPTAVASVLHLRRAGQFSWALIGMLSAGSLAGVLGGRQVARQIDTEALQVILGVVVVLAGVGLLALPRWLSRRRAGGRPDSRTGGPVFVLVIVVAGALGGLATVLAGVGGPLLTVPALLLVGTDLTSAVAAATMNSLLAIVLAAVSLTGTAPVHLGLVAALTVVLLTGVLSGVVLHHRIAADRVVPILAAVSILSGSWMCFSAPGS